MTPAEILTIIALVLSLIALCVVAYQTYLNRKSLLLTKQSIDEDRRIRQINMLPNAHFVFQVQYCLKKWLSEIQEITEDIEKCALRVDVAALKNIAGRSRQSPKGLVDGYFYEKGPRWLAEIWLAGAQYYYDFSAPLRDLHNQELSVAGGHLLRP